jgi:hypothetical protein
MDPLPLLLWGLLLPAVATMAVAALLARIAPPRPGLRESIAVAAAVVASWLALEGMPALPPKLAHEWLPVVAVLAAVVAAAESILPSAVAMVAPAAGCAAAMVCIGWLPGWSTTERAGFSAVLLAVVLVHHGQMRRIPEPERAWLLPAISGATAVAIAASGMVAGGAAAAALASSQVVLLLIHSLRPSWVQPGAATTAAAVILLGLWQIGAWFNDLPYPVLLLIAAAPCAYLLPGTPRRLLGRSTRTWLAVLMLGAAAGLSLWYRSRS